MLSGVITVAGIWACVHDFVTSLGLTVWDNSKTKQAKLLGFPAAALLVCICMPVSRQSVSCFPPLTVYVTRAPHVYSLRHTYFVFITSFCAVCEHAYSPPPLFLCVGVAGM